MSWRRWLLRQWCARWAGHRWAVYDWPVDAMQPGQIVRLPTVALVRTVTTCDSLVGPVYVLSKDYCARCLYVPPAAD